MLDSYATLFSEMLHYIIFVQTGVMELCFNAIHSTALLFDTFIMHKGV
jgi:hypothetical protein